MTQGDAASAAVRGRTVRTLRWREQRFVFELSSPDDGVVSLAEKIFAAPRADPGAVADRSWHVEEPGDRDAELLRIEWDALDFLLRNNNESVAVHAALLSRNDKGVVIVGPSLAGKSTLATALWRSGWSLLADDLVFIDAPTRSATPAPRRVSLRTESRDLVGQPLWDEIQRTPSCIRTAKGLFFHPHEVTGAGRIHSALVSGIFFLARRGAFAGQAEAIPINPAKAAISLLPYAGNLRGLPFMDGLRRITPLADAIPAWDLGRGDLADMVAIVERLIA